MERLTLGIEPVFASLSVSLTGFLSNPLPVLDALGSAPVAVLHGDRPLFYVLSPTAMQNRGEAAPPPAVLAPELPPPPPPTAPPARRLSFDALADLLLQREAARAARGEIAEASVAVLRNRLDAHIRPHFSAVEVAELSTQHLDAFLVRLQAQQFSTTTLAQYMVIVRKLLKLARREKLLAELPELPQVKVQNRSRTMLTVREYRRLIQVAGRLSRERRAAPKLKEGDGTRGRFWVQPRHLTLPPDVAWVIVFMVNSFVRPSDIKVLQHQHVTVVRGEHVYLRLNLPETKRHDKPMVTLRPAVRVYEALLRHARGNGHGAPTDHVFLPEVKDRQYALALLGFWLRWVMREAGISQVDHLGSARTLYSLRHTSIMYRLLYGQGIDMLTLARNARTSVDMIERFYASALSGEMNVGLLQSRRQQRPQP